MLIPSSSEGPLGHDTPNEWHLNGSEMTSKRGAPYRAPDTRPALQKTGMPRLLELVHYAGLPPPECLVQIAKDALGCLQARHSTGLQQ